MLLLFPALRRLLVWLAVSAATGLGLRHLGGDVLALLRMLTGLARPAPFAELLALAAAAALLGCAIWLWAVVTVLAARPGGDQPVLGCPDPVRRLIVLACGTALAGALSAPASAHSALDGLPLPDRVTGAMATPAPVSAQPAAAPATAPEPGPVRVRVRVGDSLWTLAADALPAGASEARIADLVERIHRLNATTIGPDRDLIHPGQLLRLPRSVS